MSDSLWPHGLYSSWNSPGQNSGVGNVSLFQGIFQTQGSNPDIPNCRQSLYQLSHKGNPRILKWVAYPNSSRYSWPRNWTGVSCIAGGFFTNWAIREKRIVKSRDITLLTKVHLVKTMFCFVFFRSHVCMWELDHKEGWTEKLMLWNCGVGEDSWESLGLQGDPTSPS